LVSAYPLHILVIEDEAVIRSQIAAILEEEGYRVSQAADTGQAYDLLIGEANLALVITDVRLPGAVDGPGFAKVVERYHAGLPILAISGGERPHEDDMRLRTAFLQKPFMARELVSMVAALTSRPRAEP
jgi:DNA-binding response OmpR family regulator